MPQDKRKSIRYRSFVTCVDPKGVVECGVIRKSKINCPKKDNKIIIEGEKKQGNSSREISCKSLAVIKEDNKKEMSVQRITRELKTCATFQLLEVSKGGDKVNHVINSLSKEKGHQDHITDNLLRGAIDLQESLIMLEKLKKEASSIMSKSRRKHKEKFGEGRFDGMLSGVNAVSSNEGRGMQDEEVKFGWERPRKSGHELKKVVRESLLRQSVITNPIFEEDFDYRKVDCSEMPSTSSSQSSSMVRSSNFAMSDCSTSSTASQRRQKKESNLIVKLMGMDSPPTSPRWYRDGDRLLNLSKPVYQYDIDSPRARKHYFGAQELYRKQRTVEEILESLNFKGLLRNSCVYGRTAKSPSSETLLFKDKRIDDRPPIVLMKTSRYHSIDLENPTEPNFWLGEVVKPTCSTLSGEEKIGNVGTTLSEKYNTAGSGYEAGSKCSKKDVFTRSEPFSYIDQKPKKKQSVPRKASKVEKVAPARSKEEEKKNVKSREELSFRDQEKLTTPRLIKQTDGRFISKHHISNHQEISSSSISDHKNQDMCSISGQQRRSSRPGVIEANKKGKAKVIEAVYIKEIASTSENEPVVTTANSMAHERFTEQNWSRTCQTHIKDYDIGKTSYNSKAQEVIKHHPNNRVSVGDIVLSGTLRDFNRFDNNQDCCSEITSVSTSEHSLVNLIDGNHSPVSEVILVTTHENGIPVQSSDTLPLILTESGARSSKEIGYRTTSKSALTPRAKLKTLLLNNRVFVSNLDVLFDLLVHPDLLVPALNDEEAASDVCRAKLLLDYANEVIQLKRSQSLLPYLPQHWSCSNKPQNSASLDRLLDDICNGIEDLRCYHRPSVSDDDNFSSDNLYFVLSRDLSFNSGIWDSGWKRMCSQHEIEQVIGELDRAFLGKLIEEVVSEFLV